jgi:predicted esterase
MSVRTLAATGVLIIAATATGQSDRFELGRRLIEFERTWESCGDAAAKKRTVAALNQVVGAFFSFRLGEAGRLLDEARRSLLPVDPPDGATRWADSLVVQPRARVVDAAAPTVEVTIREFYQSRGRAPPSPTVRLRLGDGPTTEFSLGRLPTTVSLPLGAAPGLASADLELAAEVSSGKRALCRRTATLSRVERLATRLEAIDPTRAPSASSRTIEALTAAGAHALIRELSDGRVRETNYPAARLLAEAEAALQCSAKKESYFGPQRPGEFWLTVPVDRGSASLRVFIPPGLTWDDPVPVVVALHGAGGSENLFFEGYGDGATLKRCRARGWVMIAPRSGMGFALAPPVTQIVDALARIYPIDAKRVFLMGHSMGAGQTAVLASLAPDRFAAVALLGGGGLMRPDNVKVLPVFIGCGAEDFALRGARSTQALLAKAGATRFEYKEYPDVEHVTIVQAAADDVFAFFEKAIDR